MDRAITLTDDGTQPDALPLPFDTEGYPRQPVTLIGNGRALGVVCDSAYGAKIGMPSTGHAVGLDETEAPMPLNLHLAAGSDSFESLLQGCVRGLYVPRFHYVNGFLNPREGLMTGLTREGAFLIKDGRLDMPVTTLRFTQRVPEAFSAVLGLTRERRLIADPNIGLGSVLAPAVRLARFAFTGHSG